MNEPVLAKLDAAQDRVLAQLERILVSGCLGQAESLNRLLRYLVLETLAGRSHRLKEYTLGVEVFQRGPDFDPRVDTIVRTQARRLRAKLQEFYSADRKPGEIVIELSKGSYVPRFHETAPAQPAPRRFFRLAAIPSLAMAAALVLSTFGLYGYRYWSRNWNGRLSSASSAQQPQISHHAAHLAKAELYVQQSLMAAAPAVDLLPKARDAAMRALEFGSDFTAVHAILATVAAYHDWDWDSAEKEYQKALALDPQDPFVRLQYAKLLVLRGRTDAAMEQVGRIGAVHPRRAVLEGGQAGVYYLSRQYDRAIAHCKAVLEVMPDAGDCSYWMGRAYLSKGMAAEAIDALEGRRSNPAMGFAGPIAAYLAAGQRNEALRLRAEVEALAERQHISPVSLATMYFSFGEQDSGFRQLDRAIQDRDPSLLTLRVEPAYDQIRPDPRFQKILRRLRL